MTPVLKEGIKNVCGSITFALGVIEIYQTFREREPWEWTADKVVIACARISLILSAAVSRPGVYLLSAMGGYMFTPLQIESLCGRYAVFAVNPWHPRHLLSLLSIALALPLIVQSIYRRQGSSLQWRATFNTLSSRPMLHLGHRLIRL